MSSSSVNFERRRFFSRRQEEGESVQEFMDALRTISMSCEFEQTDILVKHIFIANLASAFIRSQLMISVDRSLDEILQIARALENTEGVTEQLEGLTLISEGQQTEAANSRPPGVQQALGAIALPRRNIAINCDCKRGACPAKFWKYTKDVHTRGEHFYSCGYGREQGGKIRNNKCWFFLWHALQLREQTPSGSRDKTNKCGHCKRIGHNITNCPMENATEVPNY